MVLVTVDSGTLSGFDDDGISRFRGVPYAAAPFGENRFRYPQPVTPWDGVRDATEKGAGSPQARFVGDPFDSYFNPPMQGEDSLNVDICTPDPGAVGLPVMVWIHGGGFMTGYGAATAHDGASFARDGIVHVGLNYRLGIEGFVYLGEGTDNLGLRDMVAALEWVQRNITKFGGDPGNVTIFGQSGGALGVMDVMAMPSARGLFARAIAQSGSPAGVVDVEEATRVTTRLAERLGIAPTREGFASVRLERTIAETIPMALEFIDPTKWGQRSFMVSPYRAVSGTPSLPETVLEAAANSAAPLMTGTCRNEATGFLMAFGPDGAVNDDVAAQMLPLLGVGDDVQDAYRGAPRHLGSPLTILEAAWTDYAFRIPTLQLAEARTAPTWIYEFHWESPALPRGLGSNHALEVPFVRDDLAAMRALGPAGEATLGPDAPEELAQRMHAAWAAFARTGNPGWPVYTTDERSTMVFDTVSRLENDTASPEREAWEGNR